ncbi:MAG: FAD-dependent oxidoreductase [Candidatus Nealsonbacteria bacterium]|nr:FAD-dependent oxidoreductase [Candidatus Nealsonbacteria bacterium]
MDLYSVRIKDKKEIADNTLLFVLEKPENFKFRPGQFLMLILPQLEESVERGNSRPMSIASPPYQEEIYIAIRRGITPFKKKLESLNPGEEVKIRGPYGVFVLYDDLINTIVFLAGGIGITPVRSIILQSQFENKSGRFFLFYSNNLPKDAAFLEELGSIKGIDYKLVSTMTKPEGLPQDWEGEKGFIDFEMIKKYVSDVKEPIYYVVGPPGFVEAMKTALVLAGIDKAKIKVEEFKGF